MLIEELYTTLAQDSDTFIVQKDGAEEANIVDTTERTCTCEDFRFRHEAFGVGAYKCKHMRMVALKGKIVLRSYDNKLKIEELIKKL